MSVGPRLHLSAVAGTAGILGACLLACTAEPPRLSIDVPAETLFIGLVTLNDGAPELASGLVRWEPGEGLPLFVDGTKDHWVIGFTEQDLASLWPLDEEVVSTAALRVAKGCEPRLPAPSWRASWASGASKPNPAGPELELPHLTADWLENRCEDLEASRWTIDTSCYDFSVFAAVNPTGRRCSRELGLATYQIPTLLGHVWYDGRTCLEPAAMDGTCVQSPEEPSVVECSGRNACRVELGLSGTEPPPFLHETISLVPNASFYRDRVYDDGREYRALRTRHGYVRTMVVQDDHIWVVRFSDRVLNRCPSPTAGPLASELVQVSKESFTIVATATAPPCLLELAAGPGTDFFGGYAEDGQNWIGRFRQDGQLVQRRVLGNGPGDLVSAPGDLQFTEIQYLGGLDELVVVMSDENLHQDELPSQILALDPDTFEERRRIRLDGLSQVHSLRVLEGERAAIGFQRTNATQFIDLRTFELSNRVGYEHDPGIGTHGLGYAAPYLYLAAYTLLFMFDGQTGVEVKRALVSARPMNLLAAEPWPKDPNLILVLGTSQKGYEPLVTLATFFDVRERRFRPSVFETGGYGVPHAVTADGEGGFLVLHPWSGELTRIKPIDP